MLIVCFIVFIVAIIVALCVAIEIDMQCKRDRALIDATRERIARMKCHMID
jgi:hypothetical protein